MPQSQHDKNERQKAYYYKNREYLKEKAIEWRGKNHDHLLECYIEYYEKNKEYIREYKKSKVICECGMITDKAHQARHRKGKKHLDLISKKN